MKTATFGAGCFWGVEVTFGNIPGVEATCVGYAGGDLQDPTYQDVCAGDTGHTEVVRLSFDPDKVTFAALLDALWDCHDPTQVNRQGPDAGYQYRSVVFCEDDEQFNLATASKQQRAASGKHARPIATSIERSRSFYEAEEYHQQYLVKRGLAVCHV